MTIPPGIFSTAPYARRPVITPDFKATYRKFREGKHLADDELTTLLDVFRTMEALTLSMGPAYQTTYLQALRDRQVLEAEQDRRRLYTD